MSWNSQKICQRGYLCNTGCNIQQPHQIPHVDQMKDELVGEMSEIAKDMEGKDKENMMTAIMHLKQACEELKKMSPGQKQQLMMQAEMMMNNEDHQQLSEENQSGREGYRNWGNKYMRNRYYPWKWHYYRNPYYVYYSRPYYSYYSPYYYGYPYGPYYGYGYYW